MKATTLPGHNNPIYTVIAHPDEELFYTAGNDKGVVEWNLETQVHQRIFNQLNHTVYALEIIPDLKLLVAGCNDGSICFFDSTNTSLLKTLKISSAVFHLKYIPAKSELLASTDKGDMLVIDPENYEKVHQFRSGNEKTRSFAHHQHLNLLATVSNDEMIRIYALDDYTLIHEFRGHDQGVGSVAFSPEGVHLLTGGRDAHLKVWNTSDWTCHKSFAAHLFAVYQIIFHPTLPYFATASRDKSIKIWRSEDFSLFRNLSIGKAREGHLLSVNDICWSADGNHLISVSDDKMVKIWDFDS